MYALLALQFLRYCTCRCTLFRLYNSHIINVHVDVLGFTIFLDILQRDVHVLGLTISKDNQNKVQRSVTLLVLREKIRSGHFTGCGKEFYQHFIYSLASNSLETPFVFSFLINTLW